MDESGADPRDWVRDGQWVEAFAADEPEWVVFSGEVIGFYDQPTVVVRKADGTRQSWVATECRPTRRENPNAWMDAPERAAFRAGLRYAQHQTLAGSALSKLTPAEAFYVWSAIQRGAEKFERGKGDDD